jgi:hypothetical protein
MRPSRPAGPGIPSIPAGPSITIKFWLSEFPELFELPLDGLVVVVEVSVVGAIAFEESCNGLKPKKKRRRIRMIARAV